MPTPTIKYLLGVGIAGVCIWYLSGSEAADGARSQTAPLPASGVLPKVQAPASVPQPAVGLASDVHLDKTPPRQTRGLDLVKLGWTYDCMECHKMLTAKWHYDRPMVEHENIQLDHGNNRFCLNCHHPSNRNAFVDYDGAEIAESDVVLLCAKCHGPTYRDWQAGAHGRRNGYWDRTKGEQTRLRCIQCHDPHQPRFQPMQPLPPLRYPARAAYPPGPGSAHETSHSPEVAR